MSLFKKIFLPLISIIPLHGCSYGDPVLYGRHPETEILIDEPDSKASKKIFDANAERGWFFIPQPMFSSHEGKAWLALRVYSRNTALTYEIVRAEVAFPEGVTIEAENVEPEELKWYPVENGWFYQVVEINVYRYSSMFASNVPFADVSFELKANEDVVSEKFKVLIWKVRYSNWWL